MNQVFDPFKKLKPKQYGQNPVAQQYSGLLVDIDDSSEAIKENLLTEIMPESDKESLNG